MCGGVLTTCPVLGYYQLKEKEVIRKIKERGVTTCMYVSAGGVHGWGEDLYRGERTIHFGPRQTGGCDIFVLRTEFQPSTLQ